MTSSIAAIHVAKKQLGLDEETYRAKLSNITGKSSAKDMTEAERQKVLTVFRNDGFEASSKASQNGLQGKFAKKLQALWIAGYNLGVVRDRRDAALIAFVKRQTGLDHARFLHHADDARSAIEALKAWLQREAGVKFTGHDNLDWMERDTAKIAWAQWKILHPEADRINRRGFDQTVATIIGQRVLYLAAVTDREWQVVMNRFGEQIRSRKAGA